MGDKELLATTDLLGKLEQRQIQDICKLGRELDRTNKMWKLKMTVMRKNFHALKDEIFIRHSLQRRASVLHHATVGYAVNVLLPDSTPQRRQAKAIKPSVQLVGRGNTLSERPSISRARAEADTTSTPQRVHDKLKLYFPEQATGRTLSDRGMM